MKKFRITKYNPNFRNKKGAYLIDEWTSVSDIGKNFHNGVFKKDVYYEIENKYLQAIKYVLDENNIFTMRVIQLEKYNNDFDISLSNDEQALKEALKNDSIIGRESIETISKMILRELLWAILQTNDGLLTIEFGYDYYMYVICEKISECTKKKIISQGLFVEEIDM